MKIPSNKPRKSITLLSLWVILIILTSTVFLSPTKAIDSPGTAESGGSWTPEALVEEFPNLTSPEIVYLQITGVNVSSEETRAAYLHAKEKLESMGAEVSSYYELEGEISNQASEVALVSLKNATDVTTEVYTALIRANKSFGTVLTQSVEIYPLFELLNSTLPELRKAYWEEYSNASQRQVQFSRLQEVLNESDREYLSIHRNLTAARGIINNLTPGVVDFSNHLDALQKNYTVTFLRVIWTYKGLRDQVKAYEIGSAYLCRVASLSLYLHLPEDFIYQVFYATYPAYEESGYAGITDELLANVTANFVLESMNTSPYKAFDREFGRAFVMSVAAYDVKQGSKTAIIENTQNQIEVVSQIVNETLSELPSRLSSSSSIYYFPYLGNVSGQNMSFILREVKSQNEPQKSAVNIATSLGIKSIPQEYYLALLTGGPLETIEISLLNETISRNLPDELKGLSYNISEIIAEYERENGYTGVLSSNSEALRNATLEVIDIASPEKPENPELLSPEKAATNAVSKLLLERLSNSTLGYPQTLPEIVVESIASYPAENLSEEDYEDILSTIFTRAFGPYSGMLVKKFYSGASPEKAAIQVFDEAVIPRLLSNSSSKSSQTIKELLGEIPNQYPLTQSYLKETSLNATLRIVSSWKPRILGVEIPLPAPIIAELAWEFRGHSDLITESDASEISKRIYESALRMNENRVLALKGPKNDSLILIVKTSGKTSDITPEKVESAFSSAFTSINPSARVTVIAPLDPTSSPIQERPDFTFLLIAASLIGALTLLLALRGALLASLVPAITIFVTITFLLNSTYGGLRPEATITGMGLLLTSSLAFTVSYRIIESFRKSLAISPSEGSSAVGVFRESIYGILVLTALSGAAAAVLGFPIIESITTGLLIGIPVFIAIGIVLLLSTRTLGDKLVFWWPLNAEKVLQNDEGGNGLLKTGFAVFLITLAVTGSIAYLLNSSENSGLEIHGTSAYIVLSSEGGIAEGDLQTVEKVAEALTSLSGVAGVYTLTRPYGVFLNLSEEQLLDTWASGYVSGDGKAVLIVVRITGKHPANVEKLIQDKLEGIARSNSGIAEVSYEKGIAVLKIR